MRALQVSALTGPDALIPAKIADPLPSHPLTPGDGVVIDVHAAGVAFADVLQSRGLYQLKPEPPFVPGMEVAGVVRRAPDASELRPADRVAAFTQLGGFAEIAVAPVHLTFALPAPLDFAQGAALVLNHHTATFALVTRGRLQAGEDALVHGAGGGVGSATLQIARGLGARTIAVVSSDEKERVARQAGAHDIMRADGRWRDAVRERTGGGVDLVIDPLGGERFTDSLRSLRAGGRLVVVGFTSGSIPEVKVNRLLLGNTEVIGAAWPEWVIPRPAAAREIGQLVTRSARVPSGRSSAPGSRWTAAPTRCASSSSAPRSARSCSTCANAEARRSQRATASPRPFGPPAPWFPCRFPPRRSRCGAASAGPIPRGKGS